MIWFSLAKMALKTGAEVYKNKKETEQLQSVAAKNHMAKMAAGEIEYQNAVRKSNDQGIKDDIDIYCHTANYNFSLVNIFWRSTS